MKVLVACEESQRVCTAFRNIGHDAYSCDIIECSGGHPEWHIRCNVLDIINGRCSFITDDLLLHRIDDKWDMIIAFPPCTHLCISGARWFDKKRADGRQEEAIKFFYNMILADCDHIAVENPIGIISGDYIYKHFGVHPLKPTQIIHPYMFGDPVRKATCLWLKGLPKLEPTIIVEPEIIKHKKGNTYSGPAYYAKKNEKILSWNDSETAKIRSKTYLGIAEAMAEQWG